MVRRDMLELLTSFSPHWGHTSMQMKLNQTNANVFFEEETSQSRVETQQTQSTYRIRATYVVGSQVDSALRQPCSRIPIPKVGFRPATKNNLKAAPDILAGKLIPHNSVHDNLPFLDFRIE